MRLTLDRQLARMLGAAARRLLIGSGEGVPALTVGVVDDPLHPVRLVRIAGIVDPVTVDRVIRAWEHVTAPYLVHLDLRDARIVDTATMTRLESALDDLEGQRIDVRIVGIDPHHPAIVS